MSHKHKQQRPESPMVTLTWHVSEYKVHKLHHRYMYIYILKKAFPQWHIILIIPSILGTLSNIGVHRHKTEPVFIHDRSPLISKLAQHINTQIHTFTC